MFVKLDDQICLHSRSERLASSSNKNFTESAKSQMDGCSLFSFVFLVQVFFIY